MRHRIVLSAAGLAIAGGTIVAPVAPAGGDGASTNALPRGEDRRLAHPRAADPAGLFHVQINTLHNDNGEIRGQIGRLYTVRTVLNAAQEVPRRLGFRPTPPACSPACW